MRFRCRSSRKKPCPGIHWIVSSSSKLGAAGHSPSAAVYNDRHGTATVRRSRRGGAARGGALRATHQAAQRDGRADRRPRARAWRRSRRSSTPRSGRACAARKAYTPRISLAYLPPEQAGAAADVRAADAARRRRRWRRVAPAVERAGHSPRRLARATASCRSGARRARFPTFCFVLEVARPGLLVVKHHRGDESGKFVNVAVLEGDQIKIDRRAGVEPARLPAAADVAARLRRAGLVGRVGERARPARGVDARARPRRRAARGAVGQRDVARVDRAADCLRRRAAVLRARRSDAASRRTTRAGVAGRARPGRRRHRRPDGRRRRDDHHRPLRAARVRREDHAPRRVRRGSSR